MTQQDHTSSGAPSPYPRVDFGQVEARQLSEQTPLRIRWWGVVPLAALLAAGQAVLNLTFEFGATSAYLIATQISVIAFAILIALSLVVNPLLRVTRLCAPFNRAELMALFAAVFVSAGISSFGLVDQLIPLIATPYNASFNVPQRGWSSDIIPSLRPELYITDPAAIEQYRQGFPSGEGVWRRVPWSLWVKPLALWMIFVFAVYVIFYSLSMLLYDSWARREKLVFPLSRLPEDMLPDEGAPAGAIPSTLKNGLFWIGFAGVFGLLSYNAACMAGWLTDLQPVSLGINEWQFRAMFANSIFKGISDGGSHQWMALIIFTAVGIGFLLSLEISASIWIYYLIGIGMMMVAIWTAAGSSTKSFTSDWLWENHFVSSLGAGGLLAFSAAALGKVLYEHYVATVSERPDAGPVETATRTLRRLGWAGALFAASCAVALAWLAWCHIPLHWGAAFLAVAILITVGLMRIVSEGGVYWFQLHTGPFHLTKMAEGLNTAAGGVKSIVPGSVIAPLMPIYSVLFLDIKTYMAPLVLGSFKMQEEVRASRRWFHAAVVTAIIVTVIVSCVTMLCYVYAVGANRANGWFFTAAPTSLLDQTQRLVGHSMGTQGQYNWIFYLLGAGWVVLSLVVRRWFFWWLHPIGFIMLANPLITQVWFSFFLGWACKKIATAYGGRHMFARLRPFFIGMIFGELISCFFWAVMASTLGLDKVHIDINR